MNQSYLDALQPIEGMWPTRVGSAAVVKRAGVIVTLCLLALGCNKGTSTGAAPKSVSGIEKDVLSGKQIMQKGGLCALDEEVTPGDPEPGSDEEMLLQLYTYALAKDEKKAFEGFRKLFPDSANTRFIRDDYWVRTRRNIDKFMIEPGEPGFIICRKAKTDRGTKYYIKSNDPRQHPPPITIGEDDGERKIIGYTPF
ncbi:MAG TPA: hypothetical protein DCQ06_01740 [Myxococcales bacterium]|nr:hypothetical protein [Myxococcales bacterium]HAN30296.1 hypothetical protein [Myxococcales bacterium]|tara:strand:+ start:177 stop:767 length:591 start_codon:yes stop_codon:yes gene_type:complete